MDVERTPEGEDLLSRGDLARWSGLPERHPLVGLFHRFGGFRKMNEAFGQLSHLQGADFIDAVFGSLGVTLELSEEDLQRIPETGPFVLVSNHPYGVLDALAIVRQIRTRRPDFKWVWTQCSATWLSSEQLVVVSGGEEAQAGAPPVWMEGGLGIGGLRGRIRGLSRGAGVQISPVEARGG